MCRELRCASATRPGAGRDGVAGPDLLTHAIAGLDQARTLGDVQHLASSDRRRWLSAGTPVHYLDNLASYPGRAAAPCPRWGGCRRWSCEAEEAHLGGVGDQAPLVVAVRTEVPQRHVRRGVPLSCMAGQVVGEDPLRAARAEQVEGQIDTGTEPAVTALRS